MEDLRNFVSKLNSKEPVQTSKPSQHSPVPEPPESVTHVYTKQHSVTGLQPSYCGPFPVVSRPTRSTVQIKVGQFVNGEPKYELRSWRDLKIAHLAPDAQEASRPKRGRPSSKSSPSPTSSPSEAATNEKVNKIEDQNKLDPNVAIADSNVGAKSRPTRSTRNPNPSYIDSITGPPPRLGFPSSPITLTSHTPWSASEAEIASLNRQIG